MFKASFWMRKHGSPTWKRTWVWSTSSIVGDLDLGAMTEEERATEVETTKRYSKDGRQHWTGNSNLKETQPFGSKGCNIRPRMVNPIKLYAIAGKLQSTSYPPPRVYPYGFARAVVRLLPALLAEKPSMKLPAEPWQHFRWQDALTAV